NGRACAAAKDARSVVRVVELGAENPLRTEAVCEHFSSREHAKWRGREIDPKTEKITRHQRRSERARWIHAHPRQRGFDGDVGPTQQARADSGERRHARMI